ncbi:MAG TPA: hypothetical protein VIJ61_06560, partial [Thermoanaerobaculia bacterium]
KWIEDGVLSVYLRPDAFRSFMELRKVLEALAPELPKAKAVVMDLRALPGETYQPESVVGEINELLVSRPLRLPAHRYLVHSGYRGQTFKGSGGYFSGFMTPQAELLEPPATTGTPKPRRVVFLVSSGTEVPPVALALQAAGDGAIVAEGKIAGESGTGQHAEDLGEGYEALVRTTELVSFPGWREIHADAEVPPEQSDAAFAAALRLAKEAPPAASTAAAVSAAASPTVLPDAVWRPDKTYPEMKDPSPEYRLLAVARIWNVIHFFYPYKHLIGDWDAVLPESIAKMEASPKGARGYALALAEMAAHVTDGHTSLSGLPELRKLLGEEWAPVSVRWIEGACVITSVYGDPAVKASGIVPGDVVLSVDGKTVAERFAEFRPYVTAATEGALQGKLCTDALAGLKGSTAVLTVRGREDKPKEIKLQRGPWKEPGGGDVVRLLPGGNLGYVDLTRLTVPDVDGMFEKLKATRGIVFDMRGYPRGTAWPIAARINTRGAQYGATFRRAEVSAVFDADLSDTGFF